VLPSIAFDHSPALLINGPVESHDCHLFLSHGYLQCRCTSSSRQAHDSAPSQPNTADKAAVQSPAKGSVKEVSVAVPEEPVIAKKQAKTKGTAKSGETDQAVKLPWDTTISRLKFARGC